MPFFNVADLVCPDDPQGRTYRQINAAKTHAIPVGALVELNDPDGYSHGVRLFVVYHDRDCDQTPLYYMSCRDDDTKQKRPGFRNDSWTGGWPEEALKVIRLPEES